MELLKQQVEAYAQTSIATEWDDFSANLTHKKAAKREMILRQTDVCDEVIYILEGVAASEYNEGDKRIISRFFQAGNLCSNMVSAATQSIQSDTVMAITQVSYLTIPLEYFTHSYLHSHEIGIFFRKKILAHLIEAKNFITIKTSTSTEVQYAFLEQHYPEIIKHTPSKYIAAFMGITPEALSRFLKHRMSS